jgi:hypothetical protein
MPGAFLFSQKPNRQMKKLNALVSVKSYDDVDELVVTALEHTDKPVTSIRLTLVNHIGRQEIEISADAALAVAEQIRNTFGSQPCAVPMSAAFGSSNSTSAYSKGER